MDDDKKIDRYDVSEDIHHIQSLIEAAYALTCPPDGDGDVDISDEMMPLFYLLGRAKSFTYTMLQRSEAAWEASSYAMKSNHPSGLGPQSSGPAVSQ